ncbi:MAG: GntR family transcriptional regulator [Burkholderiales bacterium]|nr:GntR family transcriptional regulator [Burkholderiales bacterium]
MESPVPKQSLSEEAYAEIRRALLRGELEPGQRVSEPVLALRFKTSRSPIREALVRLEHEGFVERLPNGRLRVAALDIGELEQLYVVRGNVEGLAARLATPLLRTVDLEHMGAGVDEMERCVKKRNAAGAIAAGQGFHDVVTRECGNQPLVDVLTSLRARIGRFRAVVASFDDYDPDRVAEHRRILRAFYQRNAEQAEAEMIRHVQRSAAVLVRRLRERSSK